MKKVSVIIPCLNGAIELSKCLQSIAKQDYRPIEVILIDDGSVDDLQTVCAPFSIVTYIRNANNLGPAYSRNIGFHRSKGDYLLFLDSNARLIETFAVRSMVALLEKDENIGGVGGGGPTDAQGDIEYIVGNKQTFLMIAREVRITKKDIEQGVRLKECDHLSSCNYMVRRALFEQVGGFDPYYFYMGEDRELPLRIRRLGYKNVLFWDGRARHTESHRAWSDVANLQEELIRSYTRVAIKLDGVIGLVKIAFGYFLESVKEFYRSVMRSLIYSKTVAKGIFKSAKNLNSIQKVRKNNFLDLESLEQYKGHHIREKIRDIAPVNYSDELRTPSRIVLFLTLRCNAKCKHCFTWEKLNLKSPEWTPSQMRQLLRSLDPDTFMVLTGGEPLLCNDLVDIISLLNDSDKISCIQVITNGYFPQKTEEILLHTLASSSKPINVQISLDGLAETHNEIRQLSHGFEKALETIDRLKNLMIRYPHLSYVVAITIMNDNFQEIEELVAFLEQRSIPSRLSLVRGNSFSTFNVPADILDESYDPKKVAAINIDVRETMKMLKRIESRYPNYFNEFEKAKLSIMLMTQIERHRLIPCYAGYIDGVIFSNGDVAICEQVKPFGNLSSTNYDLKRLWNSAEAWSHREKLLCCACIHGCNISTSVSLKKDLAPFCSF